MKYRAIYTENQAREAAKTAMLSLILRDGYYPMYNNSYGTGIVSRGCDSDMGWAPEFRCNGKNVQDLTVSDMDTIGTVSWVSCAGNKIQYTLAIDSVLVEIDSRRDGIPCVAMREFEPSEILEYHSWAKHWGPFETLRENPEDEELLRPLPVSIPEDMYEHPKREAMRLHHIFA